MWKCLKSQMDHFHSLKVQSWQVKSSLRAVRTQDGPRMSRQFPAIPSFIGTVEGRHPQSNTEDGRLGSVRPQGNFSLARIVGSR